MKTFLLLTTVGVLSVLLTSDITACILLLVIGLTPYCVHLLRVYCRRTKSTRAKALLRMLTSEE